MHRSILKEYKHPALFYSLAIGIVWLLWFTVAYISHMQPASKNILFAQSMIAITGLAVPAAVALAMILPNAALKKDFLSRIFNPKKIKPFYFVAACLIMPASIILAQLISLFFGHSLAQFTLAKVTFSAGFFSGWVMLLSAPFLEEFAWHSYGTDTLRNKFNLFNTSIIFIALWLLFHLPLGFMKHSYHDTLLHSNWIYTANYIVSFFPYVIIVNWLYYKTGRMIFIAVIMHLTANIFAELFNTHPDSKIIQTIILMLIAIIVMIKNRELFFKR